jgi:hypothetical protein
VRVSRLGACLLPEGDDWLANSMLEIDAMREVLKGK